MCEKKTSFDQTYFILAFPRDVLGQAGTGRPAVPLSRDKGWSKCPGTNSSVPGRPRTSLLPHWQYFRVFQIRKGLSKTGEDNQKQENDVQKEDIWSFF